MSVLPTLYKARNLPLKRPVCAICIDRTRGRPEEIRLGNASELGAKSASALAVLARLGDAHFTYVDVSTPDRPVSHA